MRLDGENQMFSDLQMNDRKLVGLADAVTFTDGMNKKVLDEAVRESQKYTDNLIVQTNETLERILASIAVINGRIVTNTEIDELKETI